MRRIGDGVTGRWVRGPVGLARRARHRLTPTAPARFYGWTRFSVFMPDSASWKLSKKAELTAYKQRLWSDERMAPRCELFLRRAVPLLQEMAERYPFKHVVLYSEEMPDPWRSQLQDAAREYPVLQLLPYVYPTRIPDWMEQDLRETRARSGPIGWIRLDDDDLLARDYLDHLAEFVTTGDVGRAISFPSGYAGMLSHGRITDVRRVRKVMGSQGQAYVGSYDALSARLRLPRPKSHHDVDRRMPVILDSRPRAYLQVMHAGQDTRTDAVEVEQRLRADLAKLPKVKDRGEVLDLFPTLGDMLEVPGPRETAR